MVVQIPTPPSKDEARAACEQHGFPAKDYAGWRKRYMALRCNAPLRGSKCLLSFEEYVRLAAKAGLTKPSQIGRGIDDYNLCRKGDIGDYAVGNVAFKTKERNLVERKLNGGNTRTAYKNRMAMTGRTKKNDSGKAAQALKLSKTFEVTSPSQRVYRGRNLKEFCIKHSLSTGCMYYVCSGKKSSHKGWTGKYTNE